MIEVQKFRIRQLEEVKLGDLTDMERNILVNEAFEQAAEMVRQNYDSYDIAQSIRSLKR